MSADVSRGMRTGRRGPASACRFTADAAVLISSAVLRLAGVKHAVRVSGWRWIRSIGQGVHYHPAHHVPIQQRDWEWVCIVRIAARVMVTAAAVTLTVVVAAAAVVRMSDSSSRRRGGLVLN